MRISTSFASLLVLAISVAAQNAQTSTKLDPSVIAKGFALNGQETPAAGQVASLTSKNNYINFCAGKTITNGKQVTGGSCNPAPMGDIPSTKNIPASKFTFPKNFDKSIVENKAFTITMAVSKWQLGNFVNAQGNYYSAPQQLNKQGQIIGHSHVVIEKISDLAQTKVTNPLDFAFFKGVNGAAVNGVVSAVVDKGLPAGVYRLSSINAAANHQPVLAPVAQHGSMDDMVYFTVVAAGAAGGNNNAGKGNAGENKGAAAGNAGGANLQKFTGKLNGVAAPAVTASGKKFAVALAGGAQTFNDVATASRKSCNEQQKLCAAKGNSVGCNRQLPTCLKQKRGIAMSMLRREYD